ncbi:hypothetical protein K493DRAFT_319183 [Basidiobolus meristosporus CBS 931.73]|uniref:Uncharacterized protein n=1 Tax=Basidiobolus meristosporus CBS 931.73 TaxID=1314790 RepID=A0A1Y1XSU3_9FUNG|nr:hypothetical protein K493DRAFT_319183 [Basidiobolus meristosporus CBS 931.73]|eukprot:ORX88811.1 hypothetical protein K493DRAFT_319183 [Basidiobolus meristosporus CBS 931.73]
MSMTTLKVNKKLFKSWYEVKTTHQDVLYKYQRSPEHINEDVLLPVAGGLDAWKVTTSTNLAHALVTNHHRSHQVAVTFEFELFRSVFDFEKDRFFWILEPDDTARLYKNRKERVASLHASYHTSISGSELEVASGLGPALQAVVICSGLKTLQLMENQGRTFSELRRRLKSQEQLREDALTEGTMMASASSNLAGSLTFLI